MRRFTSFIAAIVVAFAAANASAQSFAGGSAKPVRTLEQQVYKKLLGLPNYGVFDHLTFEVTGSTVILGGKVSSNGTRGHAASAVKRVPGVTSVVNNIDQLPPSPYDDRVRLQALRTFAGNALNRYLVEPNPDVRIIVEHGRITLEGYVAYDSDRNTFNILANGIPGTFEVKNNIRIGRDARR